MMIVDKLDNYTYVTLLQIMIHIIDKSLIHQKNN